MPNDSKETLILVPGFPTNSIILEGLIKYLDQFFNVVAIDLPGFVKHKPPLEAISFENYAKYVQKTIDELNPSSYILAGISFGFLIINRLHPDDRCRGVVALEPYINIHSLDATPLWKFQCIALVSTLAELRLSNYVWNHSFFRQVLFPKYVVANRPPEVAKTILNEFDGRAFVDTVRLILTKQDLEKLRADVPYILVISRNDGRVDFDYLKDFFESNASYVHVIETHHKHWPDDISKEYFEETFPADFFDDILHHLKSLHA